MNNAKRKWLTGPYLIWAAGFIILPLFFVLFYGLTDENGAFAFANIAAIADPIHAKALLNSVIIALITTLVNLVIAYPLAWILSEWQRKHGRKNSGLIIMLFILPMWINFLLRMMAMQMLLANNGLINAVLNFFRLPEQHLLYTKTAIIIGMCYEYLPFMILPIYNNLSKMDNALLDAAHDLGAGAWQTFRNIVLPLSVPGIISGIVMVFIPSISEFVIADILGGSKILLIGNVIEQEFTLNSNMRLGSGLSVVLMCFILISMGIMNRFDQSGEDAVML